MSTAGWAVLAAVLITAVIATGFLERHAASPGMQQGGRP